MKRLLVIILWTACLASLSRADEIKEDHMEFGPFGPLTVYRKSSQPAHVVLFVSGDGGWNLGVVEMARELASLDTLVAGIDIVRYLKHLESRSAQRGAFHRDVRGECDSRKAPEISSTNPVDAMQDEKHHPDVCSVYLLPL